MRRGIVLLVALAVVLTAASTAGARAAGQALQTPDSTTVTLITGERVTITTMPNGRKAYGIVPVEGLENLAVVQREYNGDHYVIPAYALELIPDRLDAELFNVTALVEQGYDDQSRETLPALVTYRASTIDVPTLDRTRRYRYIDAAAVSQRRDRAAELGRSLADRASRGARAVDPLAGVDKVWLDRRVQVSLDESVPQIGAPAAWTQGLDGTGVTVAVLDTGIDAGHPDLVGKVTAEANFSDSDSTTDRFGHGTHVASIVAGSGFASGGLYTGVAPGASLLNAKVLGDYGFGEDSSVIAGMEWAVAQGADIVNLSLGSYPTDGTDPVSMAVNELSASSGTLFVIAAGNGGDFGEKVSAPATADAALAVGAVDGQEELASFSSTGPRIGDYAIKPEITGPGVDITAALSQDAQPIGEPVGDDYQTLSGTSMATPHVVGAAAILAQAHPDWSGDRLKTVLVGSASPNPVLTVYQQGGGRVDVPSALATEVVTEPATVNLGYFPWPHDANGTATANVTYENVTDDDVNVTIDVAVFDEAGNPAPDGMVGVDTASLTLTAGASADIDVSADLTVGEPSLYGGYLTATTDTGAATRTPIGFYKEPVRYNVTFEGIERDGSAGFGDFGTITMVNVEEGIASPGFIDLFGDMTTTSVRVAPGTYSALAQAGTIINDQAADVVIDIVETGDPEFVVDSDMTVVLDARRAIPISVAVPGAATPVMTDVTETRSSADEAAWYGSSWAITSGDVYAEPTDKVTLGTFNHVFHQTLTQGPRRLYDLVYPESGRIPNSLSYRADRTNTATVNQRYHTSGKPLTYYTSAFAFSPNINFFTSLFLPVNAPTTRRDTVSAGNGLVWTGDNFIYTTDDEFFMGEMISVGDEYAPGERATRTWYEAPTVPAVLFDQQAVRFGDSMLMVVPAFSDAQGNYGFANSGFTEAPTDTVRMRLYAGSDLVIDSPVEYAEAEVPAGPARYRLVMDVARKADWWPLGTRTHTEWQFGSDTTAPDELVSVPLLAVRYDLPVDLSNTVRPGRVPVELSVEDPTGVAGPVTSLRVWVSADGGRSWKVVSGVKPRGDGVFSATLDVASGPVSLRVVASDGQGNTVRQTIIGAFGVR